MGSHPTWSHDWNFPQSRAFSPSLQIFFACLRRQRAPLHVRRMSHDRMARAYVQDGYLSQCIFKQAASYVTVCDKSTDAPNTVHRVGLLHPPLPQALKSTAGTGNLPSSPVPHSMRVTLPVMYVCIITPLCVVVNMTVALTGGGPVMAVWCWCRWRPNADSAEAEFEMGAEPAALSAEWGLRGGEITWVDKGHRLNQEVRFDWVRITLDKLTKPNVIRRSCRVGKPWVANCLQLLPAVGGASSKRSISIPLSTPPLVFSAVVTESRHSCELWRARPGGDDNALVEETDVNGDAGHGRGMLSPLLSSGACIGSPERGEAHLRAQLGINTVAELQLVVAELPVGVVDRGLGLSQLHHKMLGIPIASGHDAPQGYRILATRTCWAVYSRADSGSFPGVTEHSLFNNDFREPCETLRLNAGGGRSGEWSPGSASSGALGKSGLCGKPKASASCSRAAEVVEVLEEGGAGDEEEEVSVGEVVVDDGRVRVGGRVGEVVEGSADVEGVAGVEGSEPEGVEEICQCNQPTLTRDGS
ncbi:hypothetical protein EI94DRAFT_1710923 [Lactarius quietus]|nr:hypothetical protein EI94DRAFT_1710923 [Lactarius quietus]